MMNQNNIGIDLLLGVGLSPEVTTSAGGQESVDGSGLPFADVLNDLLMSWPGGAARPVAHGAGEAVKKAPFSMASATDDSPSEIMDASKPAAKSSPRTTPLSTTPLVAGVLVNANESSEVIPGRPSQVADKLPATAVEKNLVAFNNDILAELPERPLVMKVSARPVVDGTAADLPSGRCEIIASKVSDGSLHLTLANPKKGAAPVELTIPTNLLSSSSKPHATLAPPTDRVDLGIAPKQIPDLDQLLARLNLKQLEVSNAGVKGENTNEPVRITLTGEHSGRKLTLRGLLPREQGHAQVTSDKSTPSTPKMELPIQSKMPVTKDGTPVRITPGVPQAKIETQPMSYDPVKLTPRTPQKGEAVRKLSSQNPLDVTSRTPQKGEAVPRQPIAEPTANHRTTLSRAASHPVMIEPTPTMKAKSEVRQKSRNQTSSVRLGSPSVIDESTKSLLTLTRPLTGVGSVVRDANLTDLKMLPGLAKQSGLGATTFTLGDDTQSADPFAGLNTWGTAGRIDGKEIPTRTVRFSLPDNLQAKLQPNGQSISIKIEPEHLGPARLSLTINHDKLRARVIVETAEVKALVERSLDRLTQQLAKAGIEIDKIEVALDGRQAGEELFDRRRQWHRPTRPGSPDPDTLAELKQAGTIPIVSEANQTYVGAGGVNVLA